MNPREAVKNFVNSDPYVQNKLVEDFEIKEFALTDTSKDFERISSDFLVRN